MAGRAVETMVWSTTARNIGSMIEKKMRKNEGRGAPGAAGSGGAGAAGGSESLGRLGIDGSVRRKKSFSPGPIIDTMGQQDEGAARRAGFGLMKTILLPVEDHPPAASAIDTELHLALHLRSYDMGLDRRRAV